MYAAPRQQGNMLSVQEEGYTLYSSDEFSVTALLLMPITAVILKDHFSKTAVREKVTSVFLF